MAQILTRRLTQTLSARDQVDLLQRAFDDLLKTMKRQEMTWVAASQVNTFTSYATIERTRTESRNLLINLDRLFKKAKALDRGFIEVYITSVLEALQTRIKEIAKRLKREYAEIPLPIRPIKQKQQRNKGDDGTRHIFTGTTPLTSNSSDCPIYAIIDGVVERVSGGAESSLKYGGSLKGLCFVARENGRFGSMCY